jgi:hypothetical protein
VNCERVICNGLVLYVNILIMLCNLIGLDEIFMGS